MARGRTEVPQGYDENGNAAIKMLTIQSKDHDIVLKTIRLLVADLCQQFGGGHPGYVPAAAHTHQSSLLRNPTDMTDMYRSRILVAP